ncbi:MAG: hypothetical protein L3V56_14440 [Candidatus Magnetoovum sp. WYHC-5]|nr:hypothetical protein [Candidatus Magnetoovum sp. WYHC-5]
MIGYKNMVIIYLYNITNKSNGIVSIVSVVKKCFCLILFISGCAFVDQKVELQYDTVSAHVINSNSVKEKLLLSKNMDNVNLSKNESGKLIIGTVRNGYGMHTADVVTDKDVGDWIINAFKDEFSIFGYDVNIVDKLPVDIAKGINLVILRVFVDQDPGFFTVGAISDIQFNVEIWKDSVKVKTVNVIGKADERNLASFSNDKELSLKKALQDALKKSIHEIIDTLN